MDFFKRIGTIKHKFKLEFFLSELTSNAALKGQIYVVIKRGERKVTSIQKCSMDQGKKCDFKKQILSFDSLTLFYDQSDKKYQQKLGQIRVILVNKKDEKKLLGVINFDAGEYANKKKQNLRFEQKLEECPQKVKMSLSFQVFIKFIGEASQTSKSKSTVGELKKNQSSSKNGKLVESIFNSPQAQKQAKKGKNDKNDKNDKNKVRTYKQQRKQKDKGSQDQSSQEQTKPKKGKVTRQQNLGVRENKNRNAFKNPGYQSDTYNYNMNSQASDQKQNKDKQQQQAELTKKLLKSNQYNPNNNKQDTSQANKNSKNKTVPVNKNKTLTDLEQSETQKKVSPDNKAQNIIQFDQVYEQQNKDALKKKTDAFSRSGQDVSLANQTRKQSEKQTKIQSLIQESQRLKQENSKLTSQVQNLKSQCNKLKDNQAKLNQKIEKLQAMHKEIQDKHENRQRETIVLSKAQQQLQQRVRVLQKEKGEYLVNVQKMKNYVKQLQIKNEQLVRHQEDQKSILSQQSRAEVKRLKDQISNHRYKIQKINGQKDELTKNNRNLKKENQEIHQEYERVQKQLAQLKLRICDQLNQANQDGDRSVVEILANLS